MNTFPLLPLRDIVVFPGMVAPLFVGREKSVAALEAAMENERDIVLLAQLDPACDDPGREDLYETGVVAQVVQMMRLPDGTMRVLIEGQERVRLNALSEADGMVNAEVEILKEQTASGSEVVAMMRSVASAVTSGVRSRAARSASATGSPARMVTRLRGNRCGRVV